MNVAFNEPKYPIDAPAFRCRQCALEIACEASYYCAVFFEAETFQRRELCEACWRGASSPEAGAFAFWRSKRPPLPSLQPRRVHFEPQVVFEFFRRLSAEEAAASAGATAPAEAMAPMAAGVPETALPGKGEAEELRFVLALLLLRKKVLSFLSSVGRDGSEWLKLSEKESGRQHLVRNPELNDKQLERVKNRLGELLQMKI